MSVYEANKSLGTKVFQVVVIFGCILVSFLCLFPFLNILSMSLSSVNAIYSGKVTLFPVDFNFLAYARVLSNVSFIKSFRFTVFLTFIYTLVTMFMTVICAYPLSRKKLKGRKVLMSFILFTMYFSGGIIPSYLVVKNLGLYDTMWALILPSAMSAYNMIIMRSFFRSIDNALMESAYLDGCTEIGILVKIILPLSTPVLATITLFYAVHRWIIAEVKEKVNVDITFVPVPRAQQYDKLNIMMASNTAPDIVYVNEATVVKSYAANGGLTDLTPYLNEYGKDLVEFYGEDSLKGGRLDGKQYWLPEKDFKVYMKSVPKGHEEMGAELHKINTQAKGIYKRYDFTQLLDAEANYGATIKSSMRAAAPKFIMCKTEDFETVYEAEIKKVMEGGAEAVIKEREAAYDALNK